MSELAERLTTRPAPDIARRVMRTEIVYAGFWRRLLAYLIDATLLAGVQLMTARAVAALAPGDFQALGNVVPVSAAIGWAYFVMMESSPAQATLGKIALGLFVVDLHGDPITFRRALFRNLFKVLSTLFIFTGWLMTAFTPRKQALHDLLAGTLVMRKVHYIVVGPEAPVEPGDHWDGARWVASAPPVER